MTKWWSKWTPMFSKCINFLFIIMVLWPHFAMFFVESWLWVKILGCQVHIFKIWVKQICIQPWSPQAIMLPHIHVQHPKYHLLLWRLKYVLGHWLPLLKSLGKSFLGTCGRSRWVFRVNRPMVFSQGKGVGGRFLLSFFWLAIFWIGSFLKIEFALCHDLV